MHELVGGVSSDLNNEGVVLVMSINKQLVKPSNNGYYAFLCREVFLPWERFLLHQRMRGVCEAFKESVSPLEFI